MNKEDLAGWLNHHITREVFKYLDDYAAEEVKSFGTQDCKGLSSNDVSRLQAENFGLCVAVERIINISIEDVDAFYNPEKEDTDETVQQTGDPSY